MMKMFYETFFESYFLLIMHFSVDAGKFYLRNPNWIALSVWHISDTNVTETWENIFMQT